MKSLFAFIFLLSLKSHGLVKQWSSTLPEDSIFAPSAELTERVEFWIKIYSFYNTNQGVFHLVDDPGFILGEILAFEVFSSFTK